MTRTLEQIARRFHQALVWLVLLPIRFYRRVLSPMKRAPTCRYVPTCSEYAVTAVRERGIVVGIALAAWRILRCNPFARGGHDPVPHRSGLHRCRDHVQEQH